MTKAQRAALDRRAVKGYAANILAVYLDADEATRAAGAVWYALEREKCADYGKRYGLTLDAVAGAASAISPGLRWDHALSYVNALQRNPAASVPTYSKLFARRAVAILKGAPPLDVLGGEKVRAFYGLLSGRDLDGVVIDGHAWNIARGQFAVFRQNYEQVIDRAATRVTAKRYRLAAAAYREIAELVGAAPHAIQAATWVHWRNITTRKARAAVAAA
jgi:hypothetical protein